MKKQKQIEFNNAPERTKLGKKVIEYLRLKAELESKKQDVDKVKLDLIQLFIAESKNSINVEGKIVTYSHVENDKITVKEESQY